LCDGKIAGSSDMNSRYMYLEYSLKDTIMNLYRLYQHILQVNEHETVRPYTKAEEEKGAEEETRVRLLMILKMGYSFRLCIRMGNFSCNI
jgi:hypothetical protein